MLTIGLTGNIGMGKSTAGRIFRELGAHVIDTDEITGQLFLRDDVQRGLVNIFGSTVCNDGRVDRAKISEIVFNDNIMRGRLEGLLHPLIFQEVDGEIAKHAPEKIVIVEAPLIFEGKYEDRFDGIINVFCPEETAIERLVQKGYPESEAKARLKSQMPWHLKNSMSRFVIDNSSDMNALRGQVELIYSELERMADDPYKGSFRSNKH